MKKLYFFFLLFFTAGLSAQQVDSLVVTPAAPTTADTVRIYIYLSFPNGPCADVAQSSVNGNTIYGNSFHCMGMLSVICLDVDTLVFPPFAAGNYDFYYSLDAGYGPPGNCTPGILPYDYDTAHFSVSTISGVNAVSGGAQIRLFPNPTAGQLTIDNPANSVGVLELVSLTGELVATTPLNGTMQEVNLSGLAEGVYFYRILSADGSVSNGKLQVIR